ncbi:MAG: hypothetical protein ACRDRV_17110 [Pseudonocardiaceae bacterium]
MTIRRWLSGVLVVLAVPAVGLTAVAGCSGDSSAPAGPATQAPEDQLTTPAAVTAGMRTIDRLAKGIAASAGTDRARAKDLADQIEPEWQPIEGTVKHNDQDSYLAMEDSFAVLEHSAQNGDATAAAKGAKSVSTTVQEYLSRYPG